MNKGLELIEAHHLFGVPPRKIDIVIHPQSVVHSLVEFIDGSLLAQLGSADMRIPISYALGWPERIPTPAASLNLVELGRLDFEAPDPERFPALRLARQALESGGGASVVLNAANEVAVEMFLAGRIKFTEIATIVEHALQTIARPAPMDIGDVVELDRETRTRVAGSLKASCA
jgi:1-deoxy-D-xylulose-5-phosphate reductoisomerase